MPLTPKHERFCIEYVVDHNGTQAAIRAGYSPRTAGSQAHDLLKKPDIANRIAGLEGEIADRALVSAEDIVRRAWEIAQHRPNGPAVMALNLLAKRHAEFSEKHEVEHSGNVTVTRNTRGLRGN